MFVSKKKYEALEAKYEELRLENEKLMDDNERLSDSNFDLWWENKLLNIKLQRKEGRRLGEYFYQGNKKPPAEPQPDYDDTGYYSNASAADFEEIVDEEE